MERANPGLAASVTSVVYLFGKVSGSSGWGCGVMVRALESMSGTPQLKTKGRKTLQVRGS